MKPGSPLFQRTLLLVKAIPEGKVLTYGGVAHLISAPGCARHVSYILSSSSRKHRLPWQRVVGSGGKVSDHASSPRQIRLLKSEGIEIERQRLDLELYEWKPTQREIKRLLKGIPEHVSIYQRKSKDL